MSETLVWVSYDLGTVGDYEGLYGWLDDHNAKECGDSVALISFEYEIDVFEELGQDLSDSVTLDKTSRIYALHKDRSNNKIKGRFIVGKRKQAPWTGYGNHGDTQEDQE